MTLTELWAEMERGKIYECSLRSEKLLLHGIQHDDGVYINPRPAILDTLLHELLHRRYPSMGERAVARRARVLVQKMTEAEKRKWWTAYNRIKRKKRPVTLDENDHVKRGDE